MACFTHAFVGKLPFLLRGSFSRLPKIKAASINLHLLNQPNHI